MAALSIGHLCHGINHKPGGVVSSRNDSRKLSLVSCQKGDPKGKKEMKEESGEIVQKLLSGVEKLGKGLQDNLSPKRKGDWKDVTLMSLSFAVYIYMSQKIVCAYCAYMSMIQHYW